MTDAQTNPDDFQGQPFRGEEWTGGAGAPDPAQPGGGFDALEGTGEPESSWLLEDDGFDLVVSSESAETESVQALPAELDALQEQAVAPTWTEEEALLGDDPMIGASYVEPETASSAATRALAPAGICMALSFGAIAVWASVKQGVQDASDEVTANLEIEGPAIPVDDPEVELVTPEIGNPVNLGRLSYGRDGGVVPADSADPTVARSTVDSPREPGELPFAPAPTKVTKAKKNAGASAARVQRIQPRMDASDDEPRSRSKEETITSRFRAHDGAGNTSAQNKRLIVPEILAARAPREFWEGANYVQHEAGWLQTEWTEGDLVVENKYTLTEGQWAANLFQNEYQLRPGKYIWRNVLTQPNTDPFNPGMRWGCRDHNTPERHFIDCDFFANLNSHGAYVSPYEDTNFVRCTFVRCGAQGLQIAYRPLGYGHAQYHGDNRPFTKKPRHVLRDSHFIDCGETGPSRSFSASYFNPGSQEFKGTLLVENCSFVAKFKEPFNYLGSLSTGALLVSPMQNNPILETNMMDLVEVRNCLFDYTKGDRAIATIRATDEVLFEDCMFIARDYGAVIDINSTNGWTGTSKCKRVTLRNCKIEGSVRLRVHKENPATWNDFLLEINMDTEGREVVIDAETGEILSDSSLGAEISEGEQPMEPGAEEVEATGKTDIADAVGHGFTSATGSSPGEGDGTAAKDSPAGSATRSVAPAADAPKGEGAAPAAITRADLPANGEDVAYEETAPDTDGRPDSLVLEAEPLDEETLRLLDALAASGDDVALGEIALEDEHLEVVEVAQASFIESVRVAPLPGDEALSAYALRFPGPGFGPDWLDVAEVGAVSSTVVEPAEAVEAGPSAAFLPFGFFGDDVAASVDVDPEFVGAEFELTGPEPLDAAAPDADASGDPAGSDEEEPGDTTADGSSFDSGSATMDGFGDPWVPLEIVMDSLGTDVVLAGSESEAIAEADLEVAEEPVDGFTEEVPTGSLPSGFDDETPAAVTVEIAVFEDDDLDAVEEVADPAIEDDVEDLDGFDQLDDDEAYPAPVTVEIVVSASGDLPMAGDDPECADPGTSAENSAAAAFETCEGDAVANERLDAIFGPPAPEIETGEPLLSDVFPAPDADVVHVGAGAAPEPTVEPAVGQDVPLVSEVLPAPVQPEGTGESATPQDESAQPAPAPAAAGDVTASAVERPSVEAPAVSAEETSSATASSGAEEVEVEVLPGLAGATATPKYRSVVRRVSTGDIWPHSTVPKGKLAQDSFVLTPHVGDVRVVFDGGETIDGRLHGVGQNRIVLDTRLGRLTLDGRRADRIDRFGRKSKQPPTGLVNTKGLDLVRVKADGGVFQGHLLSRENGKVTLLLEQGMRITLESDDVQPAVGDRSVSRIRRED